jgi:hypothetical protein
MSDRVLKGPKPFFVREGMMIGGFPEFSPISPLAKIQASF